MKKSILSAIFSSILTLVLLGGFNMASASKGSGMGQRHMESEVRVDKVQASEFSLKGNGGSSIKQVAVTRVGINEFDVAIGSITFTVQTSTTTQFVGGAGFSDIALGKIIDAKGKADPANVRILKAEQVKIRQARVASFILKDNGQALINNAAITRLGVNEFDVAVSGVTLTVRTASTTQFIGGLTFASLTLGKNVSARGTADSVNHHIINADRVGPGGLGI